MTASESPHNAAIPERLSAAIGERYRIERELGSGGMATVYLAHDIKHDRNVAVKVLRPELAAVIGADRFLAEIKTTANLQHPHILPLHDSGSVDGILFYVMPYIDGESLRDRLNREHQLPVSEATRLATEVAGALDYAHRHGTVHRDIKPENVLLHDGRALVADFGIALAVSTANSRMTETGMSLGTPTYMSPEQAMGDRDISARSDVYSLGCVTYEMLAGEPPFTGPTAQAIVARVITEEPRSLIVQRKSIPPHVDTAVKIALSKLPADRFASAAEYAAALNDPALTQRITSVSPVMRKSQWRFAAIVGGAALLAGVALGLLLRRPAAAPNDDLVRVIMSLPDSGGVAPVDNVSIAISPDGQRIAYLGPSKAGYMLWVREMQDLEGKPLAGTEGAEAPFFSPDGKSIAFVSRGGGAHPNGLSVIPAAGGMVRTVIPDSVAAWGGSWDKDGKIYFSNSTRLARVAATGGRIETLARPDSTKGQQELDFAQVLPGGKGALVQIWKGSPGQNDIGVASFETHTVSVIAKGTYPRFLPPDILLYGVFDGRVFAQRFDPQKLVVTGEPVQVLDKVAADAVNGSLQFAVSETGVLVYVPGSSIMNQVAWVSRDGKAIPVDTTWFGAFSHPALSPDGSSLAMTISSNEGSAVWVKRLPSGSLTRVTPKGPGDRPAWSPDGRSVAYIATRNAKRRAWISRADGSSDEQPLNRSLQSLDEVTLSPDGRGIVFRTEGTGAHTRKLMYAPSIGDTAMRSLVRTDYDNFGAAISPNGKWIAYVSTESRENQVYVRPYPSVDAARWTVSVNGGTEPLWAHSGKELFFRTQAGDMMSVPVETKSEFHAGTPTRLFANPGFLRDEYHRGYDVSADDKQFIMVRTSLKQSQSLGLVMNWGREVQRLTAKH
ncbi:MAG: protein kinase [Gemmatimonadales bacterium]